METGARVSDALAIHVDGVVTSVCSSCATMASARNACRGHQLNCWLVLLQELVIAPDCL